MAYTGTDGWTLSNKQAECKPTHQQQPAKTTDESNALFDVVVDYTYALDTLDNYDYQRLHIAKTTKEEPFHATYENAMHEIDMLRQKFGGSVLFGNEKDESFKSSMGQIYQAPLTYNNYPYRLAFYLKSFTLYKQ